MLSTPSIMSVDRIEPAHAESDAYALLMARTKALLPALRARATLTEEMRRLPPQTASSCGRLGAGRTITLP